MLKKDPAVKQEFERKLAEDPEFAQKPGGAAGFLLSALTRRGTSSFNLYPVYRVDAGVVID